MNNGSILRLRNTFVSHEKKLKYSWTYNITEETTRRQENRVLKTVLSIRIAGMHQFWQLCFDVLKGGLWLCGRL